MPMNMAEVRVGSYWLTAEDWTNGVGPRRQVAINFRGRGDSRAGSTLEPGDEGLRFDVLGAVRYLRRSGATAVTVVGASFGGGAAAEASLAAEAGEINGQILLAHSTIRSPEKLKGRTLFIVSRGDPQADGTPRLVSIRDQFRRAPEPKRLVVLRGSAHAQFIFDTPQSERLLQEVLAFLKAQ